MNSWGLILLAAGCSSRMGQPKQLLFYDNKSLLQRSVDAAKSSTASLIVVVLGYRFVQISEALEEKNNLHIVENKNWPSGIASSVVAGIRALLQIEQGVEKALFMTCDQPHVSGELLDSIANCDKSIAACRYGETIGVPAAFSKVYFNELLTLEGDCGAKNVIVKHMDEVGIVPFPKGHIDIDSPMDYQLLTRQSNGIVL